MGLVCMQQISCLPCTVTDKVYNGLLRCGKETFVSAMDIQGVAFEVL